MNDDTKEIPFDPRGKLTVNQLLNGAWLTDTEIKVFLEKLRQKFKHVNGLEDPVVMTNDLSHIKKRDDFIHVVISNNNHWVCVASGFEFGDVDRNDICLFDSSPRHSIDKTLEKNIGKLLPTKRKGKVMIRLQNTQKQQECFCGYFALANATALCYGLDPEELIFDEYAIRQHYIDCVYRGKSLSMFPYKKMQMNYEQEHKYFVRDIK